MWQCYGRGKPPILCQQLLMAERLTLTLTHTRVLYGCTLGIQNHTRVRRQAAAAAAAFTAVTGTGASCAASALMTAGPEAGCVGRAAWPVRAATLFFDFQIKRAFFLVGPFDHSLRGHGTALLS